MKLWIFIIAELQQVRSSFGLIVYNAAGCIIWILQSQEFTKENNSNLLCSWSSGDKPTSPLTTLQPLPSIRGQQQVVRASSISWHSQSSISAGCWEGTALACASFLSLRSYFSCVPEKFTVPAQHLDRLILFWSIHPNCVIPVLTLYHRQETWAQPIPRDWIDGIFCLFLTIFLIISDRHFYILIWLVFWPLPSIGGVFLGKSAMTNSDLTYEASWSYCSWCVLFCT